ncbi:hypothetical protein [Massilia sp. DWR3-1-1]|uniref:hypothetical protein n=1 Tax=Massilia sp. DWR3-1-1 TaxID=2804559 RepID=UPI003CF6723E
MFDLLSAGAALALTLGLAAPAQARQAQPCPDFVPAQSRCYSGQDAHGAFYTSVIPPAWNGVLVVHSHGGPSLKTPTPDDALADLKRFAVMVREGFAWTGSSYRHAGLGVRDAAEDTDLARQAFWSAFGRPRRTILHGQSWGGNVAAKAAELYARDSAGTLNYDGVLLTSAIVSGGSRAYDFRADLRALYQYYCNNLPAAGEPAYPLWQGLALEHPTSAKEVEARLNACTGVKLAPAARSAQQQAALRNLVAVSGIAEPALAGHLNWATGHFRDLTMRMLGGLNPFSNIGVSYRGSDDDMALNAGVARFAASPEGLRRLAFDSDLSGKLEVPTLTLHGIDDPTVYVEVQAAFRDTVRKAGADDLLVQSFSNEREHSKLATPEYATVLHALMDWIEQGRRPTPAALASACERFSPTYGEPCHFNPGYVPRPLETRVPARRKPALAP